MRGAIFLLAAAGLAQCTASVALSRARPSLYRQNVRAAVDPDVGYSAIGSLIRQGPLPFIQRVSNPAKYEASLRYYMEENRCSYAEAMGNMDAYIANPNDWTLIKLKAQKGGYEPDFVNINTDPKQLALSGIWSVGIISLFVKMVSVQLANGGPTFEPPHF